MTGIVLDTQTVLDFPLQGLQLIEASAGTGKTYTIANLYLRQVVSGKKVAEILVVTFTESATDELRGRIRARLVEALGCFQGNAAVSKDDFVAALVARVEQAGETKPVIHRLQLAVRSMDEAVIYTIHGFCQRSLGEFAFNSGQQFQMKLVSDDAEYWRQALRDWWRSTAYRLDLEKAVLFRQSLGDLATFHHWLSPLLEPQHKRLLPTPPSWEALWKRFDGLLPKLHSLAGVWSAESATLLATLLDSKLLSGAKTSLYNQGTLEATFAELDAFFDAPGLPLPGAFQCLCASAIWDGLTSRHKKANPDHVLPEELARPFFDDCEQLWLAQEAIRSGLFVAALADAAGQVSENVSETKKAEQVFSFDDLLTGMHAALHGANGARLAELVRQRYPVAMIDEFQDTDPLQYGIFRRIYVDGDAAASCCLTMIGDPKQAIYSFRGGDIFTYMQAKADAGKQQLYTLGTNWRSTPGIINVVNRLFESREDAFVFREAIDFSASAAAPTEHTLLRRDDEVQAAMTLWTIPLETDAKGQLKAIAKGAVAARVHAAVADEIASLLSEGADQRAMLGSAPVRPRDIAVLVRTGREAEALRAELASRGVDAVAVGRQSVFQSDEAVALEALLQAVISPQDGALARLALTSSILGRQYTAIEATINDDNAWIAWLDRLGQLHQRWQRHGFMGMFQAAMRELDIAASLATQDFPERRLTNLLHLAELLQQASKTHPGMEAVLSWYREQCDIAQSEEAELRLESDEDLVQIVTIHKSKGLEYPIVFVPYLWNCRRRSTGGGLLAFHRGDEACLDAGSQDLLRHHRLAEKERLAEDIRLAYVALTRAASKLYVVWGAAGAKHKQHSYSGETALAYLWHHRQTAADLDEALPDAFAGGLPDLEDLQRFSERCGEDVFLTELPGGDEGATFTPGSGSLVLRARDFDGRIAADWKVASFSSLSRDIHSGQTPARVKTIDDCALAFPAGNRVGSYLHLLLERLDFQEDVEAQVLAHSRRIAARFNIRHDEWGERAGQWLSRVVQTPLSPELPGLCLERIALGERLSEMEFNFSTQRVDMEELNALLEQAAGAPLPGIQAKAFEGMVTGVIDLVFVYRGRYYIADYKSNFLGSFFDDYLPENLRQAVLERRYDLQYLLYTLALHRYLRTRISDYRYDEHFGGIFYLFLRGMSPDLETGNGIFFDRPAVPLIDRLDRQIFAHKEHAA